MAQEPDFEEVQAPGELRPWVRRYLYANRPLASDLNVQAKPTGFCYFVNFFGGNRGDYLTIDRRVVSRRTRWFLCGQITDHDLRFCHRHSLRVTIAELTATGHHRLFGTAGSEILGLAAELADIAPERACLAGRCFSLGPGGSRDGHVAQANAFFTRLAERCLPADEAVEHVVGAIERNHGMVRIAQLCAQTGIAPRELRRRFQHAVGMSPKFFAQVMQIKWAVGLLSAQDEASLAVVAQEAGFYDQAHFNRAMQRFFSESPSAFLRSDNRSFRSFYG